MDIVQRGCDSLRRHSLFHLPPPFATTSSPTPRQTATSSNHHLPIKYLPLKRVGISVNTFKSNSKYSSPICAGMADEAKKKSVQSDDYGSPMKEATEENKDLETSTKVKVPPPPEKPLPDDCCGSGCVRCVWDVYYDELEAYNKLYNSSQ